MQEMMLDKIFGTYYNGKAFRGVAQLVACLVRDQEAAGSSPATPTSGKAL